MTGIRDHGGPCPGNMRRQRVQHRGQGTLGVGAADQQRRRPDRFGITSRVGLTIFADLADQRMRVVAQLLLRRGWQTRPGAFAIDGIEENHQPAVDIASRDFFGRRREPRRAW